jgi:hypothetical protein
MRRVSSAVAIFTILLAATPGLCKSSKKPDGFEISGPTVIAFYPTSSDLRKDDSNSALFDFQLYTTSARRTLEQDGVDFEVVNTRTFNVVLDGKLARFKPAKAAPGCYFAMPGKKPRIEYGVMNDQDIVRTAAEYFGRAMKQ